jgi:hypothetical protein
MNTERIKVKAPLKHWQEILEEWVFINKKVFRVTNGDFSPYSYRERTNIGVLAGTAVKTGWSALEECSSEKTTTNDTAEVYQGRSDLLLWRDVRHDQVEAKFMRRSLNAPTLKRIETVHGKAKSDAMRSTSNESRKENFIALTFIVPWVENTIEEDCSRKINIFLDELYTELKPTIFASVFPGKSTLVGAEHRAGLGVVLIGHAV